MWLAQPHLADLMLLLPWPWDHVNHGQCALSASLLLSWHFFHVPTYLTHSHAAACAWQVPGCNINLQSVVPRSCRRKGICPMHLKASFLEFAGGLKYRFCQQCGRFEPLQAFEGSHRSCR